MSIGLDQVLLPGDGKLSQFDADVSGHLQSVDVGFTINQLHAVPSLPSLQPAHNTTASRQPYKPAFWGTPAWLLKTCDTHYYSAPPNSQANFQNSQLAPGTVLTGYGQAPTIGVYTGVEEHC